MPVNSPDNALCIKWPLDIKGAIGMWHLLSGRLILVFQIPECFIALHREEMEISPRNKHGTHPRNARQVLPSVPGSLDSGLAELPVILIGRDLRQIMSKGGNNAKTGYTNSASKYRTLCYTNDNGHPTFV